MPEKCLYFLVKEVMKDPERHVASFGRNKTRNANQKFLDSLYQPKRSLLLSACTTLGCGISLKLGVSRNQLYHSNRLCKEYRWLEKWCLNWGYLIFPSKIMQSGKLIALAYNSEAFQQEPETFKSYYMQRKRWAKRKLWSCSLEL